MLKTESDSGWRKIRYWEFHLRQKYV